jgi:type II secretory pathway component GspD/PulD (secretin)
MKNYGKNLKKSKRHASRTRISFGTNKDFPISDMKIPGQGDPRRIKGDAMQFIKKFLISVLLVFTALNGWAQRLKSMDFRNQEIIDILMVLAEVSGTSIVPDDTVTGKASFHFTDSEFEDALNEFLVNYKLYCRNDGNIIRVSRINAVYDTRQGTVVLQGEDVTVEGLIKALTRAINTSILYDPLPDITMTVDMVNLEPLKALEILALRLPEYILEAGEAYYYLRRGTEDINKKNSSRTAAAITRNGDVYSLAAANARFQEVLPELFGKAGREYSILTKTDGVLENLYFPDKEFDQLLRLILEQGNADYVIHNGVYYIIELQRRDIIKKLKETIIMPLTYISAVDFPALLPSELAAGNGIKIDKNGNALILTGTPEETEPVRAFAELIDKPLEGKQYKRFELKYLLAQDALALIPQKLCPQTPVMVPKSNAFMVLGTPDILVKLEEYIAVIDKKDEGYPVHLKYSKTDELLKNLPPSVSREDLTDSGYPNLLFFTGSKEKLELFQRELGFIDRPKPQLRYELLVVEYKKNRDNRFSKSLAVSKNEEGQGWSFLGNLSNIMNLNFDVVTQFGYQFAANLNIQLGENTAQVYADTTLNGLSGQEIRFQNTDTYRYQEFEVDADTGSISRTGVTREISSGLIVSLNGWVSGDDMITISVNATVSKQNNNNSGDTGAIPSTSERIVNTQIRTPSGSPIVLSGLIKEESDKNTKKIPILGAIPGLNLLFGDRASTKEKTEIVIYIVPYLIRDVDEETDIVLRFERYYRSFIDQGENGR